MRLLFAGIGVSLCAFAATGTSTVTFHKDVLPVLQKNCQGCHRPGEAAPMPFLTYQQTKPWAKAIKEAVALKKMPPWFADPQFGHFKNDRTLSQAEIATLTGWADSGAPEGNAKDAPKPIPFVTGWNIGKPDVIFEMPASYKVPAAGTIEYQYVIVPTNFTEDKWVQLAEIRPGDRGVVHHVIAFLRDPKSKWMRNQKPGEFFIPEGKKEGDSTGGIMGEFLVGYAPGIPPEVLEPGQAKLVKAGSDIVFQLHYTANGKATQDVSKVGVIFAKEKPTERVMTIGASNNKFVIPPNAANHQVEAEAEIGSDVKLVSLLPHMHKRGKDFEYVATFPSGETQTLLRVPRYDFNWQLGYEPAQQVVLPKGTKIHCTAHFDNSRNNPGNPDASKEVRWGDQSWEEMMIGFVEVAFPVDLDPRKLMVEKKRTSD